MSGSSYVSRRLKHEIGSVILVLALPAVLLLAFPYRAIGYRSLAERPAAAASAAFVELSDSARARAVASLRFEWQSQGLAGTPLRSELPIDLPEDESRVLVMAADPTAPAMPSEIVRPALLPPSVAAPSPIQLPVSNVVQPTIFPREVFLEIE